MIRSAALGGVFIGVLSALPFVSAGNCCCCMWMLAGGALAAYLDVQQKNRSLTAGEGAGVGALSGVIGAFVWIPIAVMIALLLGPLQRAFLEEFARNARDMPPEAREFLENFGGGTAVGTVFGFMFQLFAGTIFGAIGGVLSAAYFKKEVPPAMGGDWIPPLPQ
ncbi:MAG TPA: hypothetical protein VGQ37_20370 [Vicinamibacterales bacterium]|nr:hypothetical protein [Vicinamibacterales bacterium]